MKYFLLTLFLLFVTPALGQPYNSLRIWSPNSFVKIGEPTVEGAVATITFLNGPVHNNDETFHLEYQGIVVEILFDFTFGADTITVLTGPNYMAIPPDLTLDEYDQGEIHIYPGVS